MRRRIALFVLGFVLAAGAFLLYQWLSGSNGAGGGPRGRRGGVAASGQGVIPTWESYDIDGRPEYIITAESVERKMGPNGLPLPDQVVMKNPVATFYYKGGRTLDIRAERCIAILDPAAMSGGRLGGVMGGGGAVGGPAIGKPRGGSYMNILRSGELSGNVVMTISPDDGTSRKNAATAASNPAKTQAASTKPGPQTYRLSLLQDVRATVGESELSSEKLFLLFMAGRDMVQGDQTEAASLPASMRAVTAPTQAAATARTRPATATSQREPFQGGMQIFFDGPLELDGMRETLSSSGRIRLRSETATFDGEGLQLQMSVSKEATRIEYLRIDKGDRVLIHDVGAMAFAMAGQGGGGAGATRTSGSRPATTRAVAASGSRPATAPANDLIVKWVGPMEMHPASEEDLKLTGPKDVALEAVGSASRPVVVRDREKGVEKFTATQGRLWYHAMEGPEAKARIELEPGDYGRVVLDSPSMGLVDCEGVSINEGTNKVVLRPGMLTIRPKTAVAAARGPAVVNGAAGPVPATAASKSPTLVQWKKRMDLDLEMVSDANDPAKQIMAVKRALLSGAWISGENGSAGSGAKFDLASDVLDVLIANSSDGRTQALEHMLATGNVVVHSLKALPTGEKLKQIAPEALASRGDFMDGLKAQRLEVSTKVAESRPNNEWVAPVPTTLAAEGDVEGWQYVAKDSKWLAMERQGILTPSLTAQLRAKEKEATKPGGGAAAAGGGDAGVAALPGQTFEEFEVTDFLATGGVQVDITPGKGTGTGSAGPIRAMATELAADPVKGTAVLTGSGENRQTGKPVHVVTGPKGENSITAMKLMMNRQEATQARQEQEWNINVPVGGEFLFTLPPDKKVLASTMPAAEKEKMATPMQVTWSDRMTYDSAAKQALFYGKTLAHMVGVKEDLAALKCDKLLTVQLMTVKAGATGPASAPGSRPALVRGPATGPGLGLPGTESLTVEYIEAEGAVDVRGAQLGADNNPEKPMTVVVLNAEKLRFEAESGNLIVPVKGSMYLVNNKPEKGDERLRSNGMSAFQWEGSLTYQKGAGGNKPAGIITFDKGVNYLFTPNRPFQLASSSGGGTKKPIRQARLTSDRLVATLVEGKDPGGKVADNPVGLGGNQDLTLVEALGSADLQVGDPAPAMPEYQLLGQTLTFDVPTNTARVLGKGEDAATGMSPEGLFRADEITWHMVEDRNYFTFVRLRGSLPGGRIGGGGR